MSSMSGPPASATPPGLAGRNPKRRVWALIVVLIGVTVTAMTATTVLLYETAVEQERSRLTETAQSQARLMEAVARFDRANSMGDPKHAYDATLSQVLDAHRRYSGFGETGEFTIARREGDMIVFVARHRHFDLDQPVPVPIDSVLAEPMRRALAGRSGTMIGLDYRGETVLAAYEPVDVLDLGIVAKIDLAEVRTPFVRSAIFSVVAAVLTVLVGAWLFVQISGPMIRALEERTARTEALVQERTAHLRSEIAERQRAEAALQDLSGRLINAHEEERGRIARELHDDINQKVALLALGLGQLAERGAPPDGGSGPDARELWEQARGLGRDIHALSERLTPAHLAQVGLPAALESLCDDMSRAREGLEVGFVSGDVGQLSDEVALCLYRIAQEALANVLRHSGADAVEVELGLVEDGVGLVVSDSGDGFDLDAVLDKGGLGLTNMRERLRLVGGRMRVRSGGSQGTEITAIIPLDDRSEEG